MFEIAVTIKNVNYSSVISKTLPLVIEKMDKSSGIAQILSKFKSMPAKMAAAAIAVLPEDMQNELAIHVLSVYSERISEKLNQMAADEAIGVSFSSVRAEKAAGDAAVTLMTGIDTLNYEALAVKAFPLLSDKLQQKNSSPLFLQILSILKRVPPAAYLSFLESVPNDVKDDLTVLLLSAYESKLTGFINKIAENESIIIEVGQITARKLDYEEVAV